MICSVCGKEISSYSNSCRNCDKNKKNYNALKVFPFLFVTCGVVIGYENENMLSGIGWIVLGLIAWVFVLKVGPFIKNPSKLQATSQQLVPKVKIKANSLGAKGIAQEIEKLGHLFHAGIITADEFERGKSLFLGSPPDKAASAVELLQNLNGLKAQGVLSQSEFNVKKWEILSERLIPGKAQAAIITQRAATPSQISLIPIPAIVPAQSELEKVIACPHCQKHIPFRIVQVGTNYCPKCGGKFEAE